jgi:hypothetical protein
VRESETESEITGREEGKELGEGAQRPSKNSGNSDVSFSDLL